jgi:hypothetical protein
MRARSLRFAGGLVVLLLASGATALVFAKTGAGATPSAGHFSKSEINADRAASRGRTLSEGEVRLRREFLDDAVSRQGVTYASSDVDVVPLGFGMTALIPADVNVDSVDWSVSAAGVQVTSNFRVDGSIGVSSPAASGLTMLASGQFTIVMADWGKGTFTWRIGKFPDADKTADYYGYARSGVSEPIHSANHPDLLPMAMTISQTQVPAYKANILPYSNFAPSGTVTGNCSSPNTAQIEVGATLSQNFRNCSANSPFSGGLVLTDENYFDYSDYTITWTPRWFDSPGMYSTGYVNAVKVKQGTIPYFSFSQTVGFNWPKHTYDGCVGAGRNERC